MNRFIKKVFNTLFCVFVVSCVVCLVACAIFVLDINESKGLIPLIFLCFFVFFASQYFYSKIENNLKKKNRMVFYKNSNLIFGLISLIFFVLSIYVYWL